MFQRREIYRLFFNSVFGKLFAEFICLKKLCLKIKQSFDLIYLKSFDYRITPAFTASYLLYFFKIDFKGRVTNFIR